MGERDNSMHSFVRCMKESDSLKRLEKVTASRFQTVGDKAGIDIKGMHFFPSFFFFFFYCYNISENKNSIQTGIITPISD